MSDKPPDSESPEPSDEPKKKSRAWGWWLALILAMAYPLSLGPASLAFRAFPENKTMRTAFIYAYWPLEIVLSYVPPLRKAVSWYTGLFKP